MRTILVRRSSFVVRHSWFAVKPRSCVVRRKTYLQHPAHDDRSARFGQSLSSALVYDFEVLTGDEGRDTLEVLEGIVDDYP